MSTNIARIYNGHGVVSATIRWTLFKFTSFQNIGLKPNSHKMMKKFSKSASEMISKGNLTIRTEGIPVFDNFLAILLLSVFEEI